MKEHIKELFDAYHNNDMNFFQLEKQVFSLLDENEVGVSDSTNEHVGLPHVRKSECEAKETENISGESEQITLGNRIDSESFICDARLKWGEPMCDSQCLGCAGLFNKTKES